MKIVIKSPDNLKDSENAEEWMNSCIALTSACNFPSLYCNLLCAGFYLHVVIIENSNQTSKEG